jgi:hypothetical protein
VKRGAIVVVAAKGAYTGKPRPAVSVPRAAITGAIGECDSTELAAVDDGLRRWLGIE